MPASPEPRTTIQNLVEVDTDGDNDSAYADSIGTASYLTSLSSSIRNYKYENGRRYHAFREGSYTLPNDEQEQERMDLGHHLYTMLLCGKLYTAPVDHPQRILDMGTGTGIWAIAVADEHPESEVIGTDLSAIQPPWVPPNLTFEIDDFENEWPYSRKFDLIHGRELNGFVADYDCLFEQAFNNLNPGGWFEMQSAEVNVFSDDGGMDKAKNLTSWIEGLHESSEMFGKSMTEVSTWKDRFLKAGFEDIRVDIRIIPIGGWAKDPKLKEIGKWHQAQVIQAVGAYTPALYTRYLGWTAEEVDVLCASVRTELKDKSLHLYQKVHFISGRRPVLQETEN
ncbi:hypothetical protein FQN57_000858 [Myotisia sp. PD_48]|nr:hypothetical protein FQN57_000858 [Myotisia sp. PD_48]